MSPNSPIVPTKAWKIGLIALYAALLDAFEIAPDLVRTQNDGSVFIPIPEDTDPTAIEAYGVFILGYRAKGWHVVSEAGMEYAATKHPSEGKVQKSSAPKRELSPEEKAREEKAKALRDRLDAIRNAQKGEDTDN
jgi:hypothetical protein